MSGLLERARAMIVFLDEHAAMVSNIRSPRTDNDFGREAQMIQDLASHIERIEAERDAARKQAVKEFDERQASEALCRVRIEAAEAERDEAVKALEPFGDIDGEGDEEFPDSTAAIISFGRSKVYTVTLGNFRRVKGVLRELGL